MKFEIKNKISGNIIFSIETESWRLAVEAAIKSYADLRSADLRSADLSSANLSSADLRSANLSYANLRSADLRYADLRSADLSYANLSSADLSYADLRSADLSYANLSSAKGVNKNLTTPLRMLLDQPGPVWAYKLINEKGQGPFAAGNGYAPINYTNPGVDEFSVSNFNASEEIDCGAGISLASLDWAMKEWKPGYRILIMEFFANEPKGNLVVPTFTDGKFRVKQCRRVGEKDLKELGLVK